MDSIAVVADTHFGAKNDNQALLEHFCASFERRILPGMLERGIRTMVHVGDLMDRRKYTNHRTLQMVRRRVLDPLRDVGIACHLVIGNHDTYYRNNNALNSAEIFLAGYDNWTVYPEPVETEILGHPVAMLPWIGTEMEGRSVGFVDEATAPTLFGHLELTGFEMIKGHVMEAGWNPSFLSKFRTVLTGHYHVKSSRDNIHYLGTPYQMAFSDVWAHPKGWHVLHLASGALEFVENPDRIFHTLDYVESGEPIDPELYRGCFVKIFVKERKNMKAFERLVDRFYDVGLADELMITDCTVRPEGADDEVNPEKDIKDLLHDEIAFIEDPTVDRDTMHRIIDTVHHLAISEDLYE